MHLQTDRRDESKQRELPECIIKASLEATTTAAPTEDKKSTDKITDE